MATRHGTIGAGRGRGAWLVALVALPAVLVPTACVLWFMAAAMRNTHLAARQRLMDVYREQATAARDAVAEHWQAKLSHLALASEGDAAEAFAAVVRSRTADAAILHDEAGGIAYPAAGGGTEASPAEANTPAWAAAAALEFSEARPADAAKAYAALAAAAKGANAKALALRAQARCLAKAGETLRAIELLTVGLAAETCRSATDAQGRFIAPAGMLLALRLMDDPNTPAAAALAERLAERLNDYAPPAMPSSQRLFLMQALRRLAPAAGPLPTLDAEELAAAYLDACQPPAEPGRLTRSRAGGVWHIAAAGGRIVAMFRRDTVVAELRRAAGLDRSFAGARVAFAAPGEEPADRAWFLSVPLAGAMGGWNLKIRLAGEDPFRAAADRQNAVYLWTGVLGVVILLALGLAVAGYLSRQMRLARLKNDLIATVSHELKTPLSSMRVLVDTLLDGRCRDERQAREYLSLIARENERLSRVMENFLTFSRMERNKAVFDLAELDVRDVVAAAVEPVRERLSRPPCRLDVEIAEDLPPIRGDREALVTVLINLLDNACKYTGQDKHVVVRARAAGGVVRLEVADNGVGMSRRAGRRIFERFYQVDRRLSRDAGGCGLGLSIVKYIVDAHGGSIDVTSRPGHGSTFAVSLPALGGAAEA